MKDFLIRCEQTSAATALLIGVVSAAVWADLQWGVAVLAGAVWMFWNLRVLWWLWAAILSLQVVAPSHPPRYLPSWCRRVGVAPFLLKGPGLYGLGYLLLRILPAHGLLVGLSIPLAVMGLKAAGQAVTAVGVKG